MIGIVVAGHGQLATALVDTARSVVENDVEVLAVGIEVGDTSDTYAPRLSEAIEQIDSGNGVLVLTDMFGGTPSNVGLTVHQPGRVEVLTGVNLPMVVKALQTAVREPLLAEVARRVKEAGLRSITVATEVLGGAPSAEAPPVPGSNE